MLIPSRGAVRLVCVCVGLCMTADVNARPVSAKVPAPRKILGIAPLPSPHPIPETTRAGIAPLPSPHPVPPMAGLIPLWEAELAQWSAAQPWWRYLQRSNLVLAMVARAPWSEAEKLEWYQRLQRVGTSQEQAADREAIVQPLSALLVPNSAPALRRFLWHMVMEDAAKQRLTRAALPALQALTVPMDQTTLAVLAVAPTSARPSGVSAARGPSAVATPNASTPGSLFACLESEFPAVAEQMGAVHVEDCYARAPTAEGAEMERCGTVNLQMFTNCLLNTQTYDPQSECYQFKRLRTNSAAAIDPSAVGPCALDKEQPLGWFGNFPLWDPILELNGPAWQNTPITAPPPATLDLLPAQQDPTKGIEPNPSP